MRIATIFSTRWGSIIILCVNVQFLYYYMQVFPSHYYSEILTQLNLGLVFR